MKNFFCLCCLITSLLAKAQTETEIRTHYQEINKRITESMEQGFEGPLYLNQWVTNKNGHSWPAVGRLEEITDFWYNDPPDHMNVKERNPANVLLKVNIRRIASHLQTKEEYLFKDGRLLFYFRQEGEEGKAWEIRCWFNNKTVMFKSSVKVDGIELSKAELARDEYYDTRPNAIAIQKQAKNYQDLFVKSMR